MESAIKNAKITVPGTHRTSGNITAEVCLKLIKSNTLLFSKNKSADRNFSPKSNTAKIKVVDQIKYQGIIVDTKLTWIPHFSFLKENSIIRFKEEKMKKMGPSIKNAQKNIVTNNRGTIVTIMQQSQKF